MVAEMDILVSFLALLAGGLLGAWILNKMKRRK